jgi:hypothetical protein
LCAAGNWQFSKQRRKPCQERESLIITGRDGNPALRTMDINLLVLWTEK